MIGFDSIADQFRGCNQHELMFAFWFRC
ncbi:uncharacterized protein METZ01_LOCUS129919 [marine metagenome]|uniref:Uncharacterized protein n=1 Tax=marine metagenome TaxID=408172 RepID=A0A381YJC0_9ZZZZ